MQLHYSKPTIWRRAGFTLVELLAVIAIIAIIIVVALPALKMVQSTALQVGARQVSTAMQLARQTSISRRAPVRFVLAVDPSSGAIREDLICRAYTVCVATNDANGNVIAWIPLQDWQLLPDGVVFNNFDITSYSPVVINEIPVLGNSGPRMLGQPLNPTNAWQYFDNTNAMPVIIGSTNVSWVASTVDFEPTGYVASGIGGSGAGGLRLAQGSVLVSTNRTLIVTDTNNWVYIEFDQWGGRLRTRTRDSYR